MHLYASSTRIRILARNAVLLLVLFAFCAHAQAPLPGPNLDLWRGGEVHASVALPDGSVVVGGTFTALGGVPVTNIAKIRGDGSVDPDWAPALSGLANQIAPVRWSSFHGDPVVSALATDGDAVYAAGTISGVAGLPTGLLVVKLNASTGAVDTTFRARFTSNVYALDVDSTGVYVGGAFSSAGASSASMVPRSRLAKLSRSNGAVDANWNPGANGQINSLVLDSIGGVIVGGAFSTLGGAPRANLGRVSKDGVGAVDPAWIADAGGVVRALLVDSGSLYVGGDFFSIGGANRIFLAKLGLGGAVDGGWANSTIGGIGVTALAAQGSSLFVARNGIAGSTMRVDRYPTGGSGAPDPAWSIQVDAPPRAVSSAGSIITIGGEFDRAATQLHAGAVRVDGVTALLQPELSAELPGVVYAFSYQADGGVIVGGWFRRSGNFVRRSLLRLTSTWELDPMWQTGVDGVVCALSGSVTGTYVGGEFTEGGRARLARLTSAGQWDSAWNAGVTGSRVVALAVDEVDGAVFVGGEFTAVGGQARSRVAKLGTSNGSVVANWNPGVNGLVSQLVMDQNGSLFVAGYFTTVGGTNRRGLAKLSSADAVVAAWDPNASSASFEAMAVAGDAVYVAGGFQTIGGLPRTSVAKLDILTGAAMPAFDASGPLQAMALSIGNGELFVGSLSIGLEKRNAVTGVQGPWQPGTNKAVFVLQQLPSNEVLVGGDFTQAGGQPRRSLARFSRLVPEHVFSSGFEL